MYVHGIFLHKVNNHGYGTCADMKLVHMCGGLTNQVTALGTQVETIFAGFSCYCCRTDIKRVHYSQQKEVNNKAMIHNSKHWSVSLIERIIKLPISLRGGGGRLSGYLLL